MGQNAAEELKEALKWVEGLWNPDPYGEEGNSRLAESGKQSSASKAITCNKIKGNVAKIVRHHAKAKFVNMEGIRSTAPNKKRGSALRISISEESRLYLPPHWFQSSEKSASTRNFDTEFISQYRHCSAAPDVLTYSSDWRFRAYEEFKFLRANYLEDLMKELLTNQSDIGGKASQLEEMVKFLMIPKAEFFRFSQEKVGQMMIMIMEYIMLEI